MVRNTYIYPPGPSMRIIADIFAYTSREDAEVQLDLDLRLPHAGSRSDRTTRSSPSRIADGLDYVRAAHRRRASSVDAFARPPVVLLRDRNELLHGGCEAPRRAPSVGGRSMKKHFAPKQQTLASCCARTARPRVASAHRAGPVYNNIIRTTCIEAMAATHGRHAEPAHELPRRGARAPDGLLARIARNTQLQLQLESGTCRPVDPVGRELLRRTPHPRSRCAGTEAHRRGRGARWHGQGDRGRRAEAPDRGGRRADAGADRLGAPGDHRGEPLPPENRRGSAGAQGRQCRREADADRAPRTSTSRARRSRVQGSAGGAHGMCSEHGAFGQGQG